MTKYKSILVARYGLMLAAATIISGFGVSAQAQIGEATETADPGRVGEQFQDHTIMPEVSPRIQVKDQVPQKAPPGAANISLNLKTIQLDGVSAYSENQLASVYQAQLGTTVTLADVYGIAAALTNKYRNDGYILTQVIVPPQTIEGGKVRLRVVEGFIDNVTVQGEGEEESALELIRTYAAMISTGGALNVEDLERWLLLINNLPGVEARSVLSPSRTQTGAANLLIIVERDPFDALIAADNFGSRFLGPLQFSAAGSLNSFFGVNDRVTAQLVIAPDIGHRVELAYGAVSYLQPIFDSGTTLEVFGSHTSTEPGFNLDQFDVKGHSTLFRVKAEHPFIRSRAQNLYVHILFDWRDVRTKNNIELTRIDHLRVVRAGSRFEFLDTIFLGAAINSIGIEISKGLNVLGNSDKGDANMTRPRGDPTFFKATAEAQRLQRVTSNINVLLAAKGQASSNFLLSSEEFGVGGMNIGRAFDPSEIVGDEGVAGKIELQWNEPREISLLEDYQLFSFFDAGHIWNGDATASSLKRETISSAGAGIRANFTEETEAGLAIAFPLDRDVGTQGDKDPRVYFNVNRKF